MSNNNILLLFILLLFGTSMGLLIWASSINESQCIQYVSLTKPNFHPVKELIQRSKKL
jgi:hypothetical protein